jgi:hypothetical protein
MRGAPPPLLCNVLMGWYLIRHRDKMMMMMMMIITIITTIVVANID